MMSQPRHYLLIIRTDARRFLVNSIYKNAKGEVTQNNWYKVTRLNGDYICNCPFGLYRDTNLYQCNHIIKVSEHVKF